MSKTKQLKILVVPSDRSGVGEFRSIRPHIKLMEKYKDEVYVDFDYTPKIDDDEWLSQYDIIHYHRTLGPYEKMEETTKRLKRLGIVGILDLDDYWLPPKTHPVYQHVVESKMHINIIKNIKLSEFVTTTTSIFAQEIKKYNKNVFVLPNAIDKNSPQYTPQPTKSDRIRIGWLGGSSHEHDIELLKGVVNKLKAAHLMDKVQFVLCGFDTRGKRNEYNKDTKQVTQRDVKPMETVWYRYEKIFTDDYTTISEDYKKYLHKFNQDKYDASNEAYRRIWTKNINEYATGYNEFDISLAPLVENTFNGVKSQLKVIESGFHKKALIAQDFGPYTIDLNDDNSLSVTSRKNHKDWFKKIKYLILNPEKISEYGEKLYETVNKLYSYEVVTEKRYNLYQKLYEEKKNLVSLPQV